MRLANAKEYKRQIKHLYKAAFPKCEQAPLFFLFHKIREKSNTFYAVIDEKDFIGLVYTIQNKEMVYVFYLAITEEKRGNGYGSKVLSLVKDMYPDSLIILAIEDTADKNADNYEQRIKRLGFYERNGFNQLNIRVNEAGVIYELLGTKKGITQSDFLNLMKNYMGTLLFKLIYRRTKFEQKFNESPDDLSLLSEYSEYLTQYA